MAHTYQNDPFRVLRAALSNICETAIYAETDMGDHEPCPDYVAHLRAASRAIYEARSIEDLAAVEWIAGQAALGAESMDSAE